jgi:hypothetical protein
LQRCETLSNKIPQLRQILHQTIELGLSGIRIRRAQNGRRVSGDQTRLPDGFDMRELSPNIGDSDWYSEYAGGCGSAQTNHDLRLDQLYLRLKPGAAGLDFSRRWFFVQPALAKRFPLKVFNRICNITEVTIDLRLFQSAIQQSAGWSDEWETSAIFSIAGLFAHE